MVPPEANESISYGMRVFKYKESLGWFGAFSDHCSLFPTAVAMEKFKRELVGYTMSKGGIHFTIGNPDPNALLRKTVIARSGGKEKRAGLGSCALRRSSWAWRGPEW